MDLIKRRMEMLKMNKLKMISMESLILEIV